MPSSFSILTPIVLFESIITQVRPVRTPAEGSGAMIGVPPYSRAGSSFVSFNLGRTRCHPQESHGEAIFEVERLDDAAFLFGIGDARRYAPDQHISFSRQVERNVELARVLHNKQVPVALLSAPGLIRNGPLQQIILLGKRVSPPGRLVVAGILLSVDASLNLFLFAGLIDLHG
jgi:hypothetical protein